MVLVKSPPANAGDVRDVGSIPGSGRSPEEGMATHSSILAWKNPTKQRGPAGYSPESRKENKMTIGTYTHTHTHTHTHARTQHIQKVGAHQVLSRSSNQQLYNPIRESVAKCFGVRVKSQCYSLVLKS